MEVYWELWEERSITPVGRRLASSMFRASSTSSVPSVVAIDLPTMKTSTPPV
jgi:hypothetical protein